jgi:hypothetical protein
MNNAVYVPGAQSALPVPAEYDQINAMAASEFNNRLSRLPFQNITLDREPHALHTACNFIEICIRLELKLVPLQWINWLGMDAGTLPRENTNQLDSGSEEFTKRHNMRQS